jgi:REP element-mobilizing transposase RayT
VAPNALTAARAITDVRLWEGSRLLAWVLMPDHCHGLGELGRDDRLSSVVQRLKANTARQLRDARPGMGRVWAAGFHDRGIRDEAGLTAAARYLVMNPVRAGLVRRVGDYPFWDAVWV